MRWFGITLCIGLFLGPSVLSAQTLEGFDKEAALRRAVAAEKDWLEHEIGAFVLGREVVFAGQMTVTQRDHDKITVAEGPVLAAGTKTSLTLVWPRQQQWVQITQTPDGLTHVSRLRPLRATPGATASCQDCLRLLDTLADDALFLRLSANGVLSNVKRAPFAVELSGYMERVPATGLSLDQVLALRPDFASWLDRPDMPLEVRGRTATRSVSNMVVQRAPPLRKDPARFICNFETAYKARHEVQLGAQPKLDVRDLTLGETELCCVDNARHDGSKICGKELPQ